MSRFVSVVGKLYPGKEVVQIPLSEEDLMSGKNPVYNGPDRAALAYMVENGYCVEDPQGEIYYYGEDERYVGKRFKISDYPGRDAFTDPDVIRMARTLGYKGVAEYLDEMFGIKKEEVIAKQKSLLDKTVVHDKSVKRSADASGLGGGEDVSSNRKHRKGGFGDPDDVPAAALKQRA